MGCGCGGGASSAAGGGASSALLSGTLDDRFAPNYLGASGASSSSDGGGLVTADMTGGADSNTVLSMASSGAFWVVLLFVFGGAWYLDKVKKDSE
jgi:hypothetical protein